MARGLVTLLLAIMSRSRAGALFVLAAAMLLAGGCSGGSAEEVVLDSPSGGGWSRLIDSELTDEVAELLGSNGAVIDREAFESSWVRMWFSDTAGVMIMVGEPGGRADFDVLVPMFSTGGMSVTTEFGNDGLVATIDVTDEEGPGLGVFVAREGHFAVLVFMDAVDEEQIHDTVTRQIAAIPEYDPLDSYRGWIAGLFGVVALVVIVVAIRRSNSSIEGDSGVAPWQ